MTTMFGVPHNKSYNSGQGSSKSDRGAPCSRVEHRVAWSDLGEHLPNLHTLLGGRRTSRSRHPRPAEGCLVPDRRSDRRRKGSSRALLKEGSSRGGLLTDPLLATLLHDPFRPDLQPSHLSRPCRRTWHALEGMGCEHIQVATLVPAAWPMPGTSAQARVETAPRPSFGDVSWAALFRASFARLAGNSALSEARWMDLVVSLRFHSPCRLHSAMRGRPVPRWAGRLRHLRSGVLGDGRPPSLPRVTLLLLRASTEAGGGALPFFGVAGPGTQPPSRRRTPEKVAALLSTDGCRAAMAERAIWVARTAAELLPRAPARARRK